MADGSSSGAGSYRAAVALTPQGGVGATLAWPRRQNHGAVEMPSVG